MNVAAGGRLQAFAAAIEAMTVRKFLHPPSSANEMIAIEQRLSPKQ